MKFKKPQLRSTIDSVIDQLRVHKDKHDEIKYNVASYYYENHHLYDINTNILLTANQYFFELFSGKSLNWTEYELFESWFDRFVYADNIDESIIEEEFNTFYSILLSKIENSEISNQEIFLTQMNGIIYNYIDSGMFKYLDQILDLLTAYSNDNMLLATQGLWHFRANTDKVLAEDLGSYYYNMAVRVTKFKNKALSIAMTQKFKLEYGVFLLKVNKTNKAKGIFEEGLALNDTLGFGFREEIEEYMSNIV